MRPPVLVTIQSGPTGLTADATPTFTFTANVPATFECRVDTAEFAACESPLTTAALTPGRHVLEIRARDAAGNIGAPVRYEFTVTGLVTTSTNDRDRDTIPDIPDNCVDNPNTDQKDGDRDGIGDACDTSDASVGPTLATTVIGTVRSGSVFVRFPSGFKPRQAPGTSSSPAGRGFVPLKGAVVLPVGSVVDTLRGRVAIRSVGGNAATTSRKRKTQTSDFYQGIFRIKQGRAKRPVTEILLHTPDLAKDCPAARSARGASAAAAGNSRRRSRKVINRLWGNGKGNFRTRGRNSTATVRGTIWLTEERCDGTLTRVTRGVVDVRDRIRNRTVRVRAGRSYLARATRVAAKRRAP